MSNLSESRASGVDLAKRLSWLLLLMFGPLTGVLFRICIVSMRAGRLALAAGCVIALAAFWIGGPALISAELSRLPAAFKH
jgi:hypothetical protein